MNEIGIQESDTSTDGLALETDAPARLLAPVTEPRSELENIPDQKLRHLDVCKWENVGGAQRQMTKTDKSGEGSDTGANSNGREGCRCGEGISCYVYSYPPIRFGFCSDLADCGRCCHRLS